MCVHLNVFKHSSKLLILTLPITLYQRNSKVPTHFKIELKESQSKEPGIFGLEDEVEVSRTISSVMKYNIFGFRG